MMRVSLDNAELKKLDKDFQKCAIKINEASSSGLKRIALKVLAKAQKNIKEADSVVTGKLINSGKVIPQKDLTIDVDFNTNYAAAYEFGRKGGENVSQKNIYQWYRKKTGENDEKKLKSIAYLITRKIKLFGTKPKPFLYPAMRDSENEMIDLIKDSIKKVL